MGENTIKIGSDAWSSLLAEIAANYANGELLKHEELKERLGLKKPLLKDFETVDDFLHGVNLQQFEYMTLIDRMRLDLLKNHKVYIKNIRGDGYSIIPASDQTQYGYDLLIENLKKSFRESNLIMSNVQSVDLVQQAKDNDLRAKFGVMKQMFNNLQ